MSQQTLPKRHQREQTNKLHLPPVPQFPRTSGNWKKLNTGFPFPVRHSESAQTILGNFGLIYPDPLLQRSVHPRRPHRLHVLVWTLKASRRDSPDCQSSLVKPSQGNHCVAQQSLHTFTMVWPTRFCANIRRGIARDSRTFDIFSLSQRHRFKALLDISHIVTYACTCGTFNLFKLRHSRL